MNRLLAAILCAALLAPVGQAWADPAPSAQFSGNPTNRSTKNSSAVIATGNTFQTVLAALTSTVVRQHLTINNNNATDSCWIFLGSGTAAKGTSILLLAGASYHREWPFVPSDAIQATCVTTSDTLYIDTQ